MKCQIIFYVFCISILEMVHHSLGKVKCKRYYTVLEMKPPQTINFKKISDVLSMGYPFNTTEEYKILQENLDCLLDIAGPECESSVQSCSKPIQTIYRKPINELPTVIFDSEKEDITSPEPTTNLEVTNTEDSKLLPTESSTVEPTISSTVTTEITDIILTEPSTDITKEYKTITTEVSKNNTTVIPTEDAEIETTETPTLENSTQIYNDSSVFGSNFFNLSAEKKKEHLKTAAIITGSVAGVSFLVFLANKMFTVLKSGTYKFPDPPANTF